MDGEEEDEQVIAEEVEAMKSVYENDCTILNSIPPHFHLSLKPRTADVSSHQFVEIVLEVHATPQVHRGFLSAYDSVRTRIISLIRLAIGYVDDHSEFTHKWHIYMTGHSLGGALAIFLALELSSNQLAKRGVISITMYNFGSPKVGNKRFVKVYNEKVKDSWRIVNHKDIIPTMGRFMSYCHINQPLFLAAGVSTNSLENKDILGNGYEGDIVGESTPNIIINDFIMGEMELIEKLLQIEINIFRSIRDGSAYMQHMEDFYYITLLENVRSNYQVASRSEDVNTSLS